MIDSEDLNPEELAEITSQVQAGAALLDGSVPGWAIRVPTDERLDVTSRDRDVLGWVYGSFDRGLEALQVRDPDLQGFDFPSDVRIPNEEETPLDILIDETGLIERAEANVWATVRAAWISEIQKRLVGQDNDPPSS